jgi:hypothetical protein
MLGTINHESDLSAQLKVKPELVSRWQQTENNSKVRKDVISGTSVPLTNGWQIVHAIPGRIRLRATDKSWSSIAATLAQQLRQEDGVSEVCIHQLTGSLVITFEQKQLSLPQMLKRLQKFSLIQPHDSRQELARTFPLAVWHSIQFCQQQGLNFIWATSSLLVRMPAIKGWTAMFDCPNRLGVTTAKAIISKQRRHHKASNRSKQDLLQSDRVACTVVHAIPGRVRFSVPRIRYDNRYVRQLEYLLKIDAKAIGCRINRDAASVAIEYQPRLGSDFQMRSHLSGLIRSASDAAVMADSAAPPIFFACSLAVRRMTVASNNCCLLSSKLGKPLFGGALAARSNRLRRLGVLI